MSKMSELAAASDLADLIKGQATAMNMSAANAYDAGLAEGFRRGINRAADLVDNIGGPEEVFNHQQRIARQIRALKLKP